MSPDCNPIEHICKDLKIAVWRRHPFNLGQLEQFAQEEWAKLPVRKHRRPIVKYRDHLLALTAAKCSAIKYLNRVLSIFICFSLYIKYSV